MIEAMNEQQLKFTNFMGEHDLSHETDPRFRSLEPNVNLYDDGESFPALEFGLEEVFDPSSTTLPTVAPSSPNTVRDNTASITTFPDTPYPLTQSTGFAVGEIFSIDVSVDEDDSCCGSDNTAIEDDPNETLVGRLGVDVVFTVLPSLVHDDHVSPNPLDVFHASPSCSLPFHSPECYDWPLVDSHVVLEGNKIDYFETLGTFIIPLLILTICT